MYFLMQCSLINLYKLHSKNILEYISKHIGVVHLTTIFLMLGENANVFNYYIHVLIQNNSRVHLKSYWSITIKQSLFMYHLTS